MPTLFFPRYSTPVYTSHATVAFTGVLVGQPVTCEISPKALQDHFGATSDERAHLLAAYRENRYAIEAVGRVKLPARFEDGHAMLLSDDF